MKIACCKNMRFAGRRGLITLLLCGVLAFSFSACQTVPETTGTEGFFNLEDFVSKQIEKLAQIRPEVEKRLILNGEEDVIVTKDVNWEDEFSYFLESDISKPSLRDSYFVERTDDHTEIYHLKEGQHHPVKEFKAVYDPESGQIRQLFVNIEKETQLFDISRELKLVLNGNKDDNRVLSYEIKGVQQLVLSDDKIFEIKGEIRY